MSISKKSKIPLLALFLSLSSFNVLASQKTEIQKNLKELENNFGGRIGVYAINTGTGETFGYKESERFPLCSSFKGFVAAAILLKSQDNKNLLSEKIEYKDREIEPYSPITEKYKSTGMTVGDMSAAALQYSDNGATNILLERYLGGPSGITAFMRSIGDKEFRLDRWELDLNTAIPGDERDTSTPRAVATSLQKLALGHVLNATERDKYQEWLKGNTTGDKRIRASVPSDWVVGDKTGTCGVYGTANDYAVVWPKGKSPLVIAVYTTKNKKEEKHSDTVITDAARIVIHSIIAIFM